MWTWRVVRKRTAPPAQGGGRYRQLQPASDVGAPTPAETTGPGKVSSIEYAVYAHWPTVDPVAYFPASLALPRDTVRPQAPGSQLSPDVARDVSTLPLL